jgi:hypothetical protein
MVKEFNLIYRWIGDPKRSANGLPGNWMMRRKNAEIEKIRQRQSTTEAGQSMIGNRLVSVLGEFDSCVNFFLILVEFVFFRCK